MKDVVRLTCKSLTYNWYSIVDIYELIYTRHLGSIISYGDEIKYMVYGSHTLG